MSQTKALYRLQKLDLDLDARRKRAREIIAILEQDSVLQAAKAAVNALEEQLQPQETRVTDLNLEIKSVSDQSKQLADQLYGGSVSNPKELEDIQNKIAERKRRRENLETSLLETMLEVDDLNEQLATAQQHLDEVTAARASEHQTLQAELKRLKKEIVKLKDERKAAAKDITRENRELYKLLREKRQGHALAELHGDSCSVCGVRQTTTVAQQVRQDQGLVMCSSCGRILIAV